MNEIVTLGPEDGTRRLDRWFRRHYPGARPRPAGKAAAHRPGPRRRQAGQGRRPGGAGPGDPGAAAAAGLRAAACASVARPGAAADVAMLQRAVIYRDERSSSSTSRRALAVQGGTNTERHLDALLDGLRFGSTERPRLVHRLDKDTIGGAAASRALPPRRRSLTRAFRGKTTRKIYWALAVGVPTPPHGPDQPGSR